MAGGAEEGWASRFATVDKSPDTTSAHNLIYSHAFQQVSNPNGKCDFAADMAVFDAQKGILGKIRSKIALRTGRKALQREDMQSETTTKDTKRTKKTCRTATTPSELASVGGV